MSADARPEARQVLLGEIAAMLYRHGAHRVWVFGSLGQNRQQDRRSDIDIAVDGLAGQAFTAARLAVFALARSRVDILAIEEAPPILRWAIRQDGRLLPRPDGAEPTPSAGASRVTAGPPTLHRQRIEAVADAVLARGVGSVIDFGCGHGWLLEHLWQSGKVARLAGVDFEPRGLEAARSRFIRLRQGAAGPEIQLMQGLLTHADARFAGYQAATATEVIEHLDPQPLAAFAGVLFQRLRIPLVVLTTPNADYNVLFGGPPRLRHGDHRFEWTRAEFAEWAGRQAAAGGYTVQFTSIGPDHPRHGAPSQMAVFEATA